MTNIELYGTEVIPGSAKSRKIATDPRVVSAPCRPSYRTAGRVFEW
jgi:hypothetical protein